MSSSDLLDDRKVVREALRLLGVVSRQPVLTWTITEYPGYSREAQDLALWAYCVMPSVKVGRGWRDDYARAWRFLRKTHAQRFLSKPSSSILRRSRV